MPRLRDDTKYLTLPFPQAAWGTTLPPHSGRERLMAPACALLPGKPFPPLRERAIDGAGLCPFAREAFPPLPLRERARVRGALKASCEICLQKKPTASNFVKTCLTKIPGNCYIDNIDN